MTDSSKLVSQQLRLVEIKRDSERNGQLTARTKIDEIHYGPCVLFSRECGSQGDGIARRVGERLNWHVYDREIVEQIAERAHVRNQLVESVDEHVRTRWRGLLHPIREREGLKPETYLYYLHEIVLSLGHHGCLVIVGRGAQFLLPAECAVRVRVVEPLAARSRRIASTRHMSTDEATRFVQQCEADRAEFIRKAFHQATASPLNYDLVLNTAELSVEVAAAAVMVALQKKLGVHPEASPCAS